MRIKHFAIIPPPYGGASVYVKRLNLSLCKYGYESHAFYSDRLEGIPVEFRKYYHKLPKRCRSILGLLNFPYLYRIFKKYDIIHTHFALCMNLIIWVLHILLKKPIVLTLHNQMIEQELSNLNAVDRWVVSHLASDPKVQFTTVNTKGRDKLQSSGIRFANPVQAIVPYILPVKIGNPSDYLSAELVSFLKTHENTILFYAESFALLENEEIYGIQFMIDSFCQIKKYKPDCSLVFCIANLGNDANKLAALKEKIDHTKFSSDVYWQVGAISEMWPLHEKCAMYARPTCTDGDSVMLREALGFGLPVVASDVTKRPIGCTCYQFGNMQDFVDKCIGIISKGRIQPILQEDHTQEIIDIYKRLIE